MRGLTWNNNLYSSFNCSVGQSTTVEFGVATNVDDDWPNYSLMGFFGTCRGYVSDLTLGAAINLGFWKSLDSIPGTSFVDYKEH